MQYYGAYLKGKELWIILEYCDGGSLFDLVELSEGSLTEKQIATIIYMVLEGLAYLHKKKKIHRDIKAANILLTLNGVAKLTDFGVSAQLKNTQSRMHSKIGSPYWMSPEVLTQNSYSYFVDIWSLGITCIELAEGRPPYSEKKPNFAMRYIVESPPRGFKDGSRWSKEFNDFVSKCLEMEPNNRPTAKVLLEHPWITKHFESTEVIADLVKANIVKIKDYREEIYGDGLSNDDSDEVAVEPVDSGTFQVQDSGTVQFNDGGTFQPNNEENDYGTVQLTESTTSKPYFLDFVDSQLKEAEKEEKGKKLSDEEKLVVAKNKEINKLTKEQLRKEVSRKKEEMNKEIEKLKANYKELEEAIVKGISILEENPALKTLEEYENYTSFRMKMNTKHNKGKDSVGNSVYQPNVVKENRKKESNIEDV